MTTTLSSAPSAVVSAARSEWIKLWSLRFNRFALLGAVALTVLFTLVVASSIRASAANGYDITESSANLAASAIGFGQLPLLMIAILVITGEYGTGAIKLSLRATPLRGQLLLAKSLVASVVSFVAGLALGVVAMITATLLLGDADAVTVTELVRTPLAVGLYLASATALVIGIGAIVRSTIVAILIALLLLLAAPALTEMSNAAWLESARTYLPSTAGEIFMQPDGGAYGQGVAVAILITWALLTQLGGYLTLWLRDA
jgi:ABC-type transport system involved in multi-copper enzyme maturation permease subunit